MIIINLYIHTCILILLDANEISSMTPPRGEGEWNSSFRTALLEALRGRRLPNPKSRYFRWSDII